MGEPHLDREILSRFIEGRLSPEEARRVDQHLSICTDCRDQVDEISLLDRLEFLDALLNPGYDRAFERAANRTAEQLAGLHQEARGTEALFSELSREPPGLRRHRIVTEERFHSLKLCQLLQARSKENWFLNPAAALEWVELAVAVAQRLNTARYGSSLVEDSRALAWAYVGNAHRIFSDLWRAEQSLCQAWFHHLQAGQDISTETELLSFTSSLRNIQGRFDEAVQCLDRTISLYREGQDTHREGVILIQKGVVLASHGRFRDSISLTRAGLEKISRQRDPRILLMAKNNLMVSLAQIGEPEEAQSLLRKNLHLYQEIGEISSLAGLLWLEGLIAKSFGSFEKAAKLLHSVRNIFLDSQLGINLFLASIDLADVYISAGRHIRAKEALGEIIPFGEALGLHREMLMMARLLYAQASRG